MERKPRIALLIDADNSPASKIDLILNELSSLGETNIRRAYGNWKKPELRPWEEVLHDKAIRPMQQYDVSKGKNASDIAMVIDAVALLYNDRLDAFCLVSSDADFTPLVMHLREKGAAVYGFGEQKAPKPFVSACSRFVFLDQLAVRDGGDGIEAAQLRVPAAALKQDTAMVTLLHNAVDASVDESGWARVATIGHRIANQSSFDSRNYGYATLSKLIKATQLFEMNNEGTTEVAVRRRRPAANATG